MHKEIEDLETFLIKVKQVFKNDKAPPIVLRSDEGLQEEQHAIYQMRANHENKYYGEPIKYDKNKAKKKTTTIKNKRGSNKTSKENKQGETNKNTGNGRAEDLSIKIFDKMNSAETIKSVKKSMEASFGGEPDEDNNPHANANVSKKIGNMKS